MLAIWLKIFPCLALFRMILKRTEKGANRERNFHHAHGMPVPQLGGLTMVSAFVVVALAIYMGTSVFSACRAADLTVAQAQAGVEKGDADAEFVLGKAYYTGQGMPQDYAKALDLYRKAADQGYAKAENNLASMYRQGLGVKRDMVEAAKWYRKAAEQGAALAQANLASMLANGQGATKNCKEAAEWYEKAADQGVPDAQLGLCRLYYLGDVGFDKDYAQAAKWLAKPAAQDNAEAENLLGLLYQNGWGVQRDLKQAVALFQSAADQGNALAQRNLGVAYCSGTGIKPDYIIGYKWLILSSSQGDFIADHLIDEFQKCITKDQLHQAQKLADDFKARRPATTAQK